MHRLHYVQTSQILHCNVLYIQTGIGIGYYHFIPTTNYMHIQTETLTLQSISNSTEFWYWRSNSILRSKFPHPDEA
jgi:hypothetical protein